LVRNNKNSDSNISLLNNEISKIKRKLNDHAKYSTDSNQYKYSKKYKKLAIESLKKVVDDLNNFSKLRKGKLKETMKFLKEMQKGIDEENRVNKLIYEVVTIKSKKLAGSKPSDIIEIY